jgi:hypothetical protein
MAHVNHIRYKNYEFISIEGPALVSTFSHGPNLYPGDLDPVVHGGHTLRTAPGGNILEFTYIGGSVPSLVTSHGQIFHLGSQSPTAHGELTQGMASAGHILSGNHKVIHTNGLMPINGFYPV